MFETTQNYSKNITKKFLKKINEEGLVYQIFPTYFKPKTIKML